MAAFNPSVPDTQDPNWLGYSKPISEPEVNKSKALAFKGAGDVLEEGVKDADSLMKSHAEFLGEQLGEQEQTDFLNATKTVSSLLSSGPEAPKSLQDSMQSINNLASARGDGKVTETQYLGNLYAKAKELRASYPGYRDYIDKGIEKATGITPNANAYIKGLLSDINSRTEKAQEFKNKVITQALEANKEGVENMPAYIQALQQGRINEYDVLRAVNQANLFKYKNAVAEGNFKRFEQDQKYQSSLAEDYITQTASQKARQTIDGMSVSLGLTPQKFTDLMEQEAKGAKVITDDQWRNMAVYVNDAERRLTSELNSDYGKVPEGASRSYRQMAGANYQTKVNDALSEFKMIKQAITDKDIGTMFNAQKAAEAQIHQALWTELNDPNLGKTMLLIGAANKAGGPNFAANYLQSALGAGLNIPNAENMKTLLNNLITGSNFKGIDGMNKTVDVAAQNGASTKQLNALVSSPAMVIPNPNIPDTGKVNYFDQTFSPKEQGLLGKVEMGGTKLDGQPLRGRYEVFQDYAKPEMVREVKRLSDTYGGDRLGIFKNWMETAFTTDLFGREMKDIGNAAMIPGLKITYHDDGKNPPYFESGRGTNTSTSQGRLLTPGDTSADDAQIRKVNAMVNRLNGGIKSMWNVYQGTGGGDVALDMVNAFRRANVNSPIISGMIQAIGTARTGQSARDAFKKDQQ